MKNTFFNLPKKRQQEIKDICMQEFVEYGYDNASINRIIQNLGIAKGSFYNYTISKEDIYFYLLEEIYEETEAVQGNPSTYHTENLFDRIEELLTFSMQLCRESPLRYKLLLVSELDTRSSAFEKVQDLRRRMSQKTLSALFGKVDWSQYRFPKEDIIAIFTWLNIGLREDLRKRVDSGMEIDEYEALVRSRLALYKDCLYQGIFKTIKADKGE